MLAHRAKLLELIETEMNGYPVHAWNPVQVQQKDSDTDELLWDDSPTNTVPTMADLVFPCFLDLFLVRKGMDPVWTPEAGRGADRNGVLFCQSDVPITAASRVLMVKGPSGTFAADMSVDEAWKPEALHHLEIHVGEVAQQLAGA